jgi:hypothetical protein
MVQTTHLWEGDNGARRGRLYRAQFWTILVERKMCPALVMILKMRRQHAAQMTLIEDDDVIETFASDGYKSARGPDADRRDKPLTSLT